MDALCPASPLPAAVRPVPDPAPAPAGSEELTVVSLRHPSPETTALFTICLRDEYSVGA
ncbi:hypothetical protein [Streptomyces sp. NPDC048710]|uniref:hypothetical protein n=1 Tax=unclassified Streptomyces TaxID=2593676 RepID=UPI00371E47E0